MNKHNKKKERDLMRAACAVHIAAALLHIAAQTGFIMTTAKV